MDHFWTLLIVGLILGVKHAIEPDHVIAVSTIASQQKQWWQSSLAGVFWGIGHTSTLFILGSAVLLFKSEIPETWALSMEFLVGIMLVYLGIYNMRTFQGNGQTELKNWYRNSLFIGFIHGLAGSAALVLLTLTTVSSLGEGVVFIGVFGVGTVLGMFLVTTLISLPFLLKEVKANLNHMLVRATGVISTGCGLYYMYQLGFIEGLFKLWIQ